VCIPAYNQAKTVSDVVLMSKKYADEIIVCDDGSADNTFEIAKKAGATVIQHPVNRGYGCAIKTLFQAAKKRNADIMITLDSDGQHIPEQIPRLTESLLKNECDVVIGSRFLNDETKHKVPKYRSIGIKAITKFAKIASFENLTDAQSGFRAYSRNAVEKLELSEDGMSISTEILIDCKEKNLFICEVPIDVRYDIENSSSQNSISHGITVLSSVFRFASIRHPLLFYSLPGFILLFTSIFFMGWALELFSDTRFVSTNMILISIGTAVMGVVMIATGVILYSMSALVRGRYR